MDNAVSEDIRSTDDRLTGQVCQEVGVVSPLKNPEDGYGEGWGIEMELWLSAWCWRFKNPATAHLVRARVVQALRKDIPDLLAKIIVEAEAKV